MAQATLRLTFVVFQCDVCHIQQVRWPQRRRIGWLNENTCHLVW